MIHGPYNVKIANDVYGRMKFPNCIGAVDGKHERIKMPSRSGSLFHNYKQFSVLLLALVDADYCFVAVAVVAIRKSSDSKVFKNSNIGRKVELNQLGIPGSMPLSSDNKGKCMPFVIVGDGAFTLSEYVLRPYLNRNLTTNM